MIAKTQCFYIEGDWVPSREKMQIYNPRTGKIAATVGLGQASDVIQATLAARNAAVGWRQLSLLERIQYIKRCVDWLYREYGKEGRASPLKQLIIDETGKPLPEADL